MPDPAAQIAAMVRPVYRCVAGRADKIGCTGAAPTRPG
jgi:hypothetical protein